MKFLLVTDLDNTLVGDDQATRTLNQRLSSLREQIGLIYATGRSYQSARRLQAELLLLEPDYWITGVGTEIYRQHEQDPDWAERLSVNWDRDTIVAITEQFPDLIPQSEQEQNPWKLSFLLYSETAVDLLATLQTKLNQAGLSAQIIFSSNEDVDIVPAKGDKGLATTYLRKQLGIALDRTLVCGDSGNDVSLFEQSTLGVIVNNARSELLNWYQQYGRSHHYLARAGYAGGILEALHHFNLLP